MYKYINLIPGGKTTNNGEMYYEEFLTEFWLKPGKYYNYLNFIECNLNLQINFRNRI